MRYKMSMKVIFLKDVARVGRRGEVKEIADGYAMNFLLPRGMVEQATKEAVAAAEKREVHEKARAKVQQEQTKEALKKLDHQTIVIREKANDQGHLFKKVKREDIADKISNSVGSYIDPEMIIMAGSFLKETGRYVVHVAGEGAEAVVTIVIEAASAAP
ncbi:MAG: 50S ribosomal protein L9 [Candidatus Giovannonibacteria bacterium GW2011_GWA2_53_7]|uniref:Large ribosomal subunit protein bL9 n=1 Tax=Candidatus Giovannonibacteria bacterium GW2011_GWA2_53_7 TaxID=1618650 RepID=A0A0G2A569_9BACT|nr:MAG: 50S ribosomal protein L9 [Candidatus Giovannonibacteria bacterium GW2011_GWA2_53_7]